MNRGQHKPGHPWRVPDAFKSKLKPVRRLPLAPSEPVRERTKAASADRSRKAAGATYIGGN